MNKQTDVFLNGILSSKEKGTNNCYTWQNLKIIIVSKIERKKKQLKSKKKIDGS